MTKEKHQYQTSYLPLRNQARFWLHSEACYTEEELNQRAWILKTRANSGIYADYLANPSSWFADDSQALINVYEHSWFYSNAYKTRHVLSRDDFHVQPIDSQRVHWSALYDLMQKTGDYLLLRNKELRQDHLNQPINFFLLDLNHILKGISQNPNIKQTQEQLEYLTRYVRTVEKNISPFVGSDRLFLANFRHAIETQIQPQLTQMLESQLLRDRFGELSKTIKQLSTDRNRILHFALNINPVNPHPYTFAIDQPDDLKAYPTQAVKECGKSTTALVESPISTLKLTIEQLKNCPNFQLIDMQDKILDHYAKAISDLHELDQFQKVISQTMDLLGQAGEVYTVYQFKEQLFSLLEQIELFIDDSSIHIDEIIQANTQAYHQAIQHEQNLSFLKKWLTYEREKLNTFIHNQDTLAQFPSTTTDLIKTNQALKEHVRQVVIHLNAPKAKATNFETIAGKTQELNALINSMHQWVKVQHELKGLQPPQKPQEIKQLSSSFSYSQSPMQSKSNPSFFQEPPQKFPASDMCFISEPYENHGYGTTIQPLTINSGSENPVVQECSVQQCEPVNNYYWGLLALVPIGLIALYLLYRSRNEAEIITKIPGNKEDYDNIKTQVDDIFVELQKVKDEENPETEYAYENFEETYQQLDKDYQAHNYQVEALKELLEDLKYFYNEYYQEATSSQLFTY
ncbi:hypothetical protein [Legionella cincinnatiensis]|uniref:Some similarity with eukaryotic proteins n=1 Tax=Legionella cincinnatiensis TaxID=28085 RepID=A0A378ILQ8_9GAMM|nr:hypothetical protein [Legionella cincinnatiensis]KTC83089.1 hypothetical protein Lcin_2461 [Legionella cincinnatiensis]STX35870.1 Uncharacterised protein [Legionella cincinnatiensis]